MKKLALLATLVAVVAGSVAITNALAGDPRPDAQSLGFDCLVLGTDGTTATGSITNQSSDTLFHNGKELLHCVGQVTPDGAYHLFTGFACNLVFTGLSTNPANKDSVSKSGESQLTCIRDGFSAPASAAGAAGAR
jgi:hypothetical protein